MTSTIELSLYPLNNDYPSSVLSFLQKLKSIPDLEIQTNGMSTIVIGNFEHIWASIGTLIQSQMKIEESVFVFKIAPGRREYVE